MIHLENFTVHFKMNLQKKKYEVSLRPESAEDLKKNYEAIEHIVIE